MQSARKGTVISATSIHSEDLSVAKLLDSFYTVPDYQREYVWGSEDVEQLLDDIRSEFSLQDNDHSSDYFIGALVTAPLGNNRYEVVDGQQRLTTLTIFLCAVRDVLQDLNERMESLPSLISGHRRLSDGSEEQVDRLSLQYPDAQDTLRLITKGTMPSESDNLNASQERMLRAYRDSKTFLEGDLEADAKAIRSFVAYLLDRVKVIRIEAPSVSQALWIFETINARGKGLDATDLLKNLLFREVNSEDFTLLKSRWKRLVDSIETTGDSAMRFVRYFILGRYEQGRLGKNETYKWLRDNSEMIGISGSQGNPIGFVDSLISSALVYTRGLNGTFSTGQASPALANILRMSRTARQHLILMMAAQEHDQSDLLKLATELEKLLFVFVILRRPTNYFETKFARWANDIRDSKAGSLQDFIDASIRTERSEVRDQFRVAIRDLDGTSLPKYRLKYVLARLAQEVDARAHDQRRDLSEYLDRRVEIEHVVARANVDQLIEKLPEGTEPQRVINSLANLTLLEKSINASAGASSVEQKVESYGESRFLLTRSLAGKGTVGSSSTRPSRAVAPLPAVTPWSIDVHNARRDAIAALAVEMWID